jgi:hypothetical protein
MRFAIFVWLTVGIAGCTTEPSTSAPMDAGPDIEPTPVGACIPNEAAAGNSKHVGAYCSPGGGQCAQWGSGNATICAIDLDPEGDNFCIKVGCKSHDACGEQACCTGRVDNPIKACVPIECVAETPGVCPPIPGLEDAGTGDAGDVDGGVGGGGGAGGSGADAGP